MGCTYSDLVHALSEESISIKYKIKINYKRLYLKYMKSAS